MSAAEAAERDPVQAWPWCPACGYDLKGLQSGAGRCPECGADLAHSRRRTLRFIDLGLTLMAWGLPLVGVAWVGTFAITLWQLQSGEGRTYSLNQQPMRVALALVAIVPALGAVILARYLHWRAISRTAMFWTPLVFAFVAALTAGFWSGFASSLPWWWRQDWRGYFEFTPVVIGVVAAGVAAMTQARLAAMLEMPRAALRLRRLAWLGSAAVLGGLLCVLAVNVAAMSVAQAAQEAARATLGYYELDLQKLGVPWFWRQGPVLCGSVVFAAAVAFAAGLWLGTLVLRTRVRDDL